MRISHAAPGLAVLLVAGVLAVGPIPQAAAASTPTLVVAANQSFRPVTHVATGSLYGLATATVPADSLVEPLHPNTFVQMAAGGKQQATGDILKVAGEAAKAGAKVVDRLSDYYAGWPYQYNASNWSSVVSTQISEIKASGITNLTSYELWNEPDNTWLTSNGTFNAFWTKTFNQVRSLAPGVPIQGPSYSDNISGMQSFLQNAVATNTVPDIISWHELESSGKIAGDVATVQGLESSLGISPRPIAIEEYAAPSQVGIPGDLVGYIAQFERLGINNAELAFWNQSGALGDLLTGQGGSPNGAYWLYDWYGSMTGNMVTTTPSGSLDGAASVPSAQNQVNVVFGGGSGSTAVTVNGLNALAGFSGSSQVTATLQYTPSPGRTVAVSAPTTVSQTTYTVANGSVTVPVSSMNAAYGYHLVITPAGSGGGGGSTGVLRGAASNRCLDVPGLATANGTLLDIWDCDGGSNQQWAYQSNGELQVYGNKCLDVPNNATSAGTRVEIWDCNGGANQQWTLNSDGTVVGRGSGLCLDATGGGTANGTAVEIWTCNGKSNQKWSRQ
ncbi:ricin-type beta-trefoil lectin domain protein [Actinospica robiniae]|uniref:ricin-type beta-trefoil lectin domain protein n=1 Tax=Actinospica robiniae TaxID=304901 RepID=UPI0003FE19C9|nr:ricin-type beta-trefoil lectin domain protein [Actinospica robiniae]